MGAYLASVLGRLVAALTSLAACIRAHVDVILHASAAIFACTGIRPGCFDATDVLSIARYHLDHVWIDLQLLTAPVLKSSPAPLAKRHRDLVARTTFVGWAAEYLPRHHEERGLFVDRFTSVSPQLCDGFAKRRQCFRLHFECQALNAQA